MKRFISTFTTILLVLLCTNAYAYKIGFDPTGNGNFATGTSEATSTYYDHFKLDGLGLYQANGGSGDFRDVISNQTIVGSDIIFTESFVLGIGSGDNFSFASDTAFSNFYAKIELEGVVGATSTNFTSGTVTMFMNTAGDAVNVDYGAGDTIVATLGLELGSNMTLGSTNLGDLEGDLNLNFKFIETEFGDGNDFWDEEADDLTDAGWLLSFVNEGDITVQENLLDENNVGQVGWSIASVTAAFEVVPEPTTMLLFGFGLLGLAGITRKKD